MIRKIKERFWTNITRIILIIWAIIVIYPLVWNVLASFKTNEEILDSPWKLPSSLNFDSYIRAFTEANIGNFMLNSVIVTVLSIAALLIMVIPISYVLARFKFFGRKIIHNFFLAGLFIQTVYLMVPLFILMNDLNMADNRFWLSIVYAAVGLPFSVYLLTGFMKSIPAEFEESARIDGCGFFATLIYIIVPLARPGIITIIIFNFFNFWNEYALALVLLTSESKYTIPVGLQNLMEIQRFSTDWSALFAGLVMVLLPTIILYILTQKRLTEGISVGGLKG